MPFPLPTPDDLVRRLEARMERAIQDVRPDVAPAAISRAVRTPRGMLAILIRTFAMSLYEAHLHLRWWGEQYFPDTAEVAQLERHASIWGIARRPATKAIGRASVTGAAGTGIPAGLLLQGSGVLYQVTAAATLDAAGTAILDLEATDAGTIGNAAAGLPLSFVTLVPGLDPQTAIVDSEGIAGGAEVESDGSLQTRVVEKIRAPAHGGAAFDYPVWVQNSFAASQVRTLPNHAGAGTVGVVVAMGTAATPRVPTSAELDAMAAYLETVRPATAEVILIPVELLPVPVSLSVEPNEAAVRGAAEAAIAAFFAREAKIGERLYRSRLSEAVSAASGEYRHDISVPAGNVTPTSAQLPVPGAITWSAPA